MKYSAPSIFTVPNSSFIALMPLRASFTRRPDYHTKSSSVAGLWLLKYFLASIDMASSFDGRLVVWIFLEVKA